MAKVYTERQILTNLLVQYKERECLWNTSHPNYNQKLEREQAFQEVLVGYQMLFENATVEDLKKKIDRLRSAYRRERRKVLLAREEGEEHIPSLWYFNYLTFLNDEDDLNTSSTQETSTATSYLIENDDGSYEIDEIEPKRSKLEEILLRSPIGPVHIEHTNISNPIKEEQETFTIEVEVESFGKTIGLQLRDLHPTQRFIAEKLISEVIFYARLGQLKIRSSVVTD